MVTLKLDNLSYSLLQVERKDKVPHKHYGNIFYVEATAIKRNSKLKKFIKEKCNILERRDNVKLYIERDVHWGIGIYYEWDERREIKSTFHDVIIKNVVQTIRIPVQSVIGLTINIICDLRLKRP